VDVRKRRRRKWHTLERKKHSKTVHNQKSWKAQQKKVVAKGRSGEPSKH